MAYSQLLNQANLSSPTTLPAVTVTSGAGLSPGVSVPVGTTFANFRLTSTQWPVTADGIEWALDRNDNDGSGWREVTNGFTPEGALDRHGNMPGIYYTVGGMDENGQPKPTDHAVTLRVRFRIQGNVRIGIEREFL